MVAEEPRADAEREVMEAFHQLNAAFDRGDLEAVLELCSPEIVFLGSGDGEEATGHRGLRDMFASLASAASDTRFTVRWDELVVDLRGELALLRATGEGSLASPRRTAVTPYRLTGVLVRAAEGWRWLVYHGSEPANW